MTLMSKLMTGAGMLALSTGFAAAAPAMVENDLNLRAGPGTEYPVVAAMPAGATVDVMACQASWCRVAFNGTVGWASRTYIGAGGGVAVAPRYGAGYVSGGYAPAYGYDEDTYAYGSYGPGYSYSGGPGYRAGVSVSEGGRTFGNERRFGEETGVRSEQRGFNEGAARGERVNAGVNARSNEEHATAIKGNNPMRIRESSASSNSPRSEERATAIKGNNPMRIRESSASANSPRGDQRATAIKGNNPMRVRESTSGNASATTGAAPREGNRSRENNR
jgi:uncharacterized protein YraI